MYPRETQHDTPPKEFQLPFGGKLAADNRWVILAQIIPWGELEGEYAAKFKRDIGAHQAKHLEWQWGH